MSVTRFDNRVKMGQMVGRKELYVSELKESRNKDQTFTSQVSVALKIRLHTMHFS